MAVAVQTDGHAVDDNGDVVPVIQIESAREHLARFARTTVLPDDQAWQGFQQIARSRERPDSEAHLPEGPLECAACLACEVFSSAGDQELFKCLLGGVCANISGQAQQTQYGSENEAH